MEVRNFPMRLVTNIRSASVSDEESNGALLARSYFVLISVISLISTLEIFHDSDYYLNGSARDGDAEILMLR